MVHWSLRRTTFVLGVIAGLEILACSEGVYAQSSGVLPRLGRSSETRIVVPSPDREGSGPIEALLNWADSARLYTALTVDRMSGADRFEERKELVSHDRALRIFCVKSLAPYNGQYIHACKVSARRPVETEAAGAGPQNEFVGTFVGTEDHYEFWVLNHDDIARLNYRLLIGPSRPGSAYNQAFATMDGRMTIELGRYGQASRIAFRRLP